MNRPEHEGEGCLFALIPPLVALFVLFFIGLLVIPGQSSPLPEEPSPSVSALPGFFTPEVRRWEQDILTWAEKYNLPPELVAVVMQIESCGNPRALSPAGALGLFQVMPYHFAAGEDPFDPETNARRGLDYLRRSWLTAEQDPALALAGYNGGLGTIAQPPEAWPEETRRYVYWGAPIYADALADNPRSPRLEEWLRNGGSHLCLQAAAWP